MKRAHDYSTPSTQVSVMPVQWGLLKDIDDVEPMNDNDLPVLMEIKDVLKRHGKIERFGVALLHSHFDLGDDEIMVESADHSDRVLTLQPIQSNGSSDNLVGTIWMLRDEPMHAMAWCRRFCERSWLGHFKMHNREGR